MSSWKDVSKVPSKVSKVSRKDVLRALGLEPKRTFGDYVVPFVGLLSAGILIGAGIGMLFAPKPGRELRESLGGTLGSRFGRMGASGGESSLLTGDESRLHS